MYSAKNAEVQPKEHEGPPSKGGVWEVWTSQACITWNLHPRSIGSNNNVRKMLKNLEHVSKLIGELHKVWIYMLYIYQCISINTYTYIYIYIFMYKYIYIYIVYICTWTFYMRILYTSLTLIFFWCLFVTKLWIETWDAIMFFRQWTVKKSWAFPCCPATCEEVSVSSLNQTFQKSQAATFQTHQPFCYPPWD